MAILSFLFLYAALPFAGFMVVYFQSGWAFLFILVPVGIGFGLLRAGLNQPNGANRRQFRIILWASIIMVYPLCQQGQTEMFPKQLWRIFAMVPLLYWALWMLIREISAVRATKLLENERRSSSNELPDRSVEDRLDELERLKRRDLVTPEEYATKRQEILKDL